MHNILPLNGLSNISVFTRCIQQLPCNAQAERNLTWVLESDMLADWYCMLTPLSNKVRDLHT